MDRHPSADGFLLLNDDVALNYWTPAIQNADLNKLWFLKKSHPEWYVGDTRINGTTTKKPWYATEGARKKMRGVYRDMARDDRRVFLDSVREIAERRWGEASSVYLKAIVDTFYVPRRHVAGFKRVARVMWKKEVWSEVSRSG